MDGLKSPKLQTSELQVCDLQQLASNSSTKPWKQPTKIYLFSFFGVESLNVNEIGCLS